MLDIAIFVVYIGLVLGIGRYWSKRIKSTEDFHLCGRELGKVPAALSLAATECSGSVLIGGAGQGWPASINHRHADFQYSVSEIGEVLNNSQSPIIHEVSR